MRTRTMRTMILALAVILLAAPVWAVVYITATDLGGGVVAIDYNSVGEPNLVRGFGLNITVEEGTIVDVNDYVVGDDNYGFGIFPGTFGVLTVLGNGTVETWDVNTYTPVSAGLDTNWVTIELGSLYDTNAPGDFGRLCTVTVSSNPAYLSVTENLLSGGVVMEDGNSPVGDVNVAGATNVEVDLGDCFPSNYSTYNDWVLFGKPECWCNSSTLSGTPGVDYQLGDYQCDGDTKGDTQIIGWRIYTNDLGILATNWKKTGSDPTLDPCADIDHKGQIIDWRVYTNDLGILATNWKKLDTQLPGDCPRPE